MLIPLGRVWRRLHENQDDFELYSSDDFHPSNLGSLLEALVILKSIKPEVEIQNLQGQSIDQFFDNEADKNTFLSIVASYINEL